MRTATEAKKITALNEHLSQDDELTGESNSIKNQKLLVESTPIKKTSWNTA